MSAFKKLAEGAGRFALHAAAGAADEYSSGDTGEKMSIRGMGKAAIVAGVGHLTQATSGNGGPPGGGKRKSIKLTKEHKKFINSKHFDTAAPHLVNALETFMAEHHDELIQHMGKHMDEHSDFKKVMIDYHKSKKSKSKSIAKPQKGSRSKKKKTKRLR